MILDDVAWFRKDNRNSWNNEKEWRGGANTRDFAHFLGVNRLLFTDGRMLWAAITSRCVMAFS